MVPTEPPNPPAPDAARSRQRRSEGAAPRARQPAGEPVLPAQNTEPTAVAKPASEMAGLPDALAHLRQVIGSVSYVLPLPSAESARRITAGLVDQLDDYLVPRLRRLDAPLLVVVGGSTGVGKSTLVNSLVRAPVSPAGVLRPTTRAAVLVCHPVDVPYFSKIHLLPGLTRTTGAAKNPTTLQVVSAPALTPGLAFIDAPDIDSVVDSNRALATQLFAAADLWLFVTTAARYADAAPWDLLHAARSRGTVVVLLLDRVPPGADETLEADYRARLRTNDLGDAPLFLLPQAHLDGQGLLDEQQVTAVRYWFTTLANSPAARAAVVRQTVHGAIRALGPALAALARAADNQVAAAEELAARVRTAYGTAQAKVEQGVRDGALLRGEVLVSWYELLGDGDVARAVPAQLGRARDRLGQALTGRSAAGTRFQAALESAVTAVLRNAAADAAEQAYTSWRLHPAGPGLLDAPPGAPATDPGSADLPGSPATDPRSAGLPGSAGADLGARPDALSAPAADLPQRVDQLLLDWRRELRERIRAESAGRGTVARTSGYAVNATRLLVIIGAFATTAFVPTGAELGVDSDTAVIARRVLDGVFADQALRDLAERARDDLLERVRALFDTEAARFQRVLEAAGVDRAAAGRLAEAADAVEAARQAAAELAEPANPAEPAKSAEPATPAEGAEPVAEETP